MGHGLQDSREDVEAAGLWPGLGSVIKLDVMCSKGLVDRLILWLENCDTSPSGTTSPCRLWKCGWDRVLLLLVDVGRDLRCSTAGALVVEISLIGADMTLERLLFCRLIVLCLFKWAALMAALSAAFRPVGAPPKASVMACVGICRYGSTGGFC